MSYKLEFLQKVSQSFQNSFLLLNLRIQKVLHKVRSETRFKDLSEKETESLINGAWILSNRSRKNSWRLDMKKEEKVLNRKRSLRSKKSNNSQESPKTREPKSHTSLLSIKEGKN